MRTSVNLTRPLKDLVSTLALNLGAEPDRGPELLLKVFLTPLLLDQGQMDRVAIELTEVERRLLKGRKDQKADVSFSDEMLNILDGLAERIKCNRSEVMRRALVFSQQSKRHQKELEKLVLAGGTR